MTGIHTQEPAVTGICTQEPAVTGIRTQEPAMTGIRTQEPATVQVLRVGVQGSPLSYLAFPTLCL